MTESHIDIQATFKTHKKWLTSITSITVNTSVSASGVKITSKLGEKMWNVLNFHCRSIGGTGMESFFYSAQVSTPGKVISAVTGLVQNIPTYITVTLCWVEVVRAAYYAFIVKVNVISTNFYHLKTHLRESLSLEFMFKAPVKFLLVHVWWKISSYIQIF